MTRESRFLAPDGIAWDRALELLVSVYEVFAVDQHANHLATFAVTHDAAALVKRLQAAALTIHAEVLAISTHGFAPYGHSGLVLGDCAPTLVGPSVNLHLDQSHACAHSYPDWQTQAARGWSRIDYSLATCGPVSPLHALEGLLDGPWQVATLDLIARGPCPDSGVDLGEAQAFLPASWQVVSDMQNPRMKRWIVRSFEPLHSRLDRQIEALVACL